MEIVVSKKISFTVSDKEAKRIMELNDLDGIDAFNMRKLFYKILNGSEVECPLEICQKVIEKEPYGSEISVNEVAEKAGLSLSLEDRVSLGIYLSKRDDYIVTKSVNGSRYFKRYKPFSTEKGIKKL